MAIKRVNENPTIADTIFFDILTPDAEGCFLANPFKVDSVKIYYVERNFVNFNLGEFEKIIIDPKLTANLEKAKAAACDDPSEENLLEVTRIENEIESTAKKDTFFFKEAKNIAVFGTPDFPAWLSTDVGNALITNIPEDENGSPQFGHFELTWEPVGQREGDYFICWEWTPLAAGSKLCAHTQFSLGGATQLTTSIPTHFTNPKKYEILQERYLPDMFKQIICDGDLTPPVIQELNNSVAQGFTFLEDLVNQTQDLLDANSTHESFLPLLANLFFLKLKSGDPTLWRRQIKRAVPLYKKKGTFNALEEALAQAGITLNKFTRMWQVISQYTFQESFNVVDSTEFTLSKLPILPIDTANFELRYRAVDSDEVILLSIDYVIITIVDGVGVMTWIGDTLSIEPITLSEGDTIIVLYEAKEVPDLTQQTIENFIRTLPLSDQRDERTTPIPLKNWNVRLIEEDDPLFDVVIPTRHPFFEDVVFGQIRTEFPYSENVYNTDEYNGSKRDSINPCDIDRNFIDECYSCQSSKYTVDLEIQNLSNDRIIEAKEVLDEYTPFHAILHSMIFQGGINEFIESPVETIQRIIRVARNEVVFSGNGQFIFNRTMEESAQFLRDELATSTTVVPSTAGTAYNEEIVLFSPDLRLSQIPIDPVTSLTFLEVLSPHANSGTYTVTSPVAHHVTIVSPSPSEPLNQTNFTYRLSNERIRNATTEIFQDDFFAFFDDEVDYGTLGVKSQWDIDNTSYSGGVWKVDVTAPPSAIGSYDVLNVLPDGSLVLDDPLKTLPIVDTTGISYILKNDTTGTEATSTTGELEVMRRGRVDMGVGTILIRGIAGSVDDFRNLIELSFFFKLASTQYNIIGFVNGETHEFYIEDWTAGDMVGVTGVVYQRVADKEIGVFSYKGLKLLTPVDHEAGLPISNGQNPPVVVLEDNHFKENYLVLIDTEFFAIADIDETTITLAGPFNDWETLTAGGTAVSYSILNFEKLTASVPEREDPDAPGHDFEFIDRRGNEVVDIVTETATPMMYLAHAMNAQRKDQTLEEINQQESVSFTINYADKENK